MVGNYTIKDISVKGSGIALHGLREIQHQILENNKAMHAANRPKQQQELSNLKASRVSLRQTNRDIKQGEKSLVNFNGEIGAWKQKEEKYRRKVSKWENSLDFELSNVTGVYEEVEERLQIADDYKKDKEKGMNDEFEESKKAVM